MLLYVLFFFGSVSGINVCLLLLFLVVFFFFKHKTAYEMRISDWSSDVCSSDLGDRGARPRSALPRDRMSWRGTVGRGPSNGCSERSKIGRASCRERVCQYV